MERPERVRAELHYIILGDIYCTSVSNSRSRHCQIETFGVVSVPELPELRFLRSNMAQAPIHGAGCVLHQARHFVNSISSPYYVDIFFFVIQMGSEDIRRTAEVSVGIRGPT